MSEAPKRVMIAAIIVGWVVLVSSPCLGEMTVEKIIENIEGAHEKYMKGIKDFTIVQKPAGALAAFVGETTIYYKRAEVKRKVVYKSRSEAKSPFGTVVTIYDGLYHWSVDPMTGETVKEQAVRDPWQMWRNLDPSETHYLGEDKVGQDKTHVLRIDDPAKFWGKQQALSPGAQEELKEAEAWGKLWISDNAWVPIRWVMEGRSVSVEEGKEVTTTVKFTVDFKDYRKVDTMLIPHKIGTSITMEQDVPGMSEEDKKEMETMMQMVEALGTFEVEVTEVKVNTGLADELFDPTKLEPGEPIKLF